MAELELIVGLLFGLPQPAIIGPATATGAAQVEAKRNEYFFCKFGMLSQIKEQIIDFGKSQENWHLDVCGSEASVLLLELTTSLWQKSSWICQFNHQFKSSN